MQLVGVTFERLIKTHAVFQLSPGVFCVADCTLVVRLHTGRVSRFLFLNSKIIYVSMNCRVSGFEATAKFLPTIRLSKHLRTRQGSRRSNTGNRLELLVLIHLQHVP